MPFPLITRRWLLLWGLWLPLACSAPKVRPGTVTLIPTAEGRAPKGNAAPLIAVTVESESASNRTFATTEPPTAFALDANEAFVSTPLLPAGPERYKDWQPRGIIRVGKGYLDTLELLKNEQWLLVKSADDAVVRLYETKSRRVLKTWPLAETGETERAVLVPWDMRQSTSLVVGTREGLWLYDVLHGTRLTQLSNAPATSLGWSPDERYLISIDSEIPAQTSVLRIFRRDGEHRLALVAELPKTERVDAWALSRDNQYLARSFYPSNRVTITELRSNRTLLDLKTLRYVGSVEFSPDGRLLVVGGEGLMVVNLGNPERRTEYTYLYNNVGDVEFSPSGDAIAVATYDGYVRIFTYNIEENRITLIRTFRHDGTANVYKVRFIDAGNTLISSSGDRTVRFFGAPMPRVGAFETPPRRWKSPEQWATESGSTAAKSTPPFPTTPSREHYFPPRLEAAPLPSRISEGKYACKISSLYRLRDCWVEKDSKGHTFLEFSKDNLLGVRGVLYDDGAIVRFEGWLTEGGSLGCENCAQQPLHAIFRGSGKNWRGLLLYRGHFDPLSPPEPPPPDARFEEALDRFPIVLERR